MVYWANSLVGARIKAWVWVDEVSMTCKAEMEKVAVLPVPDWAWAIVSLPLVIGIIPHCWMGEGFSKP